MKLILHIGNTKIPYSIRQSAKAKKKRIVVKPENVEVIVPLDSSSENINAFVESKRKWIYDATKELADQHQLLLTQHYSSGAKIQYRGRWLMLQVTKAEVPDVQISYSSKFEVQVPEALSPKEELPRIKEAFELYFQTKALSEAKRLAKVHQKTLNLEAKNVLVGEYKHSWGTCAQDSIIRINWRLLQAPSQAFEYVVAHEVTHLEHRNHSDEFWALLSTTMPSWREGKAALEKWETEHRAV